MQKRFVSRKDADETAIVFCWSCMTWQLGHLKRVPHFSVTNTMANIKIRPDISHEPPN